MWEFQGAKVSKEKSQNNDITANVIDKDTLPQLLESLSANFYVTLNNFS